MMRGVLFALACAVLVACSDTNDVEPIATPSFAVDRERISVSGVSAGAYMATQFHVAYSSLVSGAGLIAGGPWGCARNSMSTALGECVGAEDPDVAALLAEARRFEAGEGPGAIDPLANLDGSIAWLFRAGNDDAMGLPLTETSAEFYEALGARVTLVTDVATVHGVPTLDRGADCDSFEPPYLNACDFDAAGEILASVHGPLAPRTEASGVLREIDVPGAAGAELQPTAFLYVPEACSTGETCGIHVFFHGCQMSSELLGDTVARDAGFNEWAESNRLLVLYPQVKSSRLAPMNPMGCFDWWGYTDERYATQEGVQLRAVKALMDGLAGGTL